MLFLFSILEFYADRNIRLFSQRAVRLSDRKATIASSYICTGAMFTKPRLEKSDDCQKQCGHCSVSPLTNQRAVFRSRDHSWPISGIVQCLRRGPVTLQSQVSRARCGESIPVTDMINAISVRFLWILTARVPDWGPAIIFVAPQRWCKEGSHIMSY